MRVKMIAILLTLTMACGGGATYAAGGSQVTEEVSIAGGMARTDDYGAYESTSSAGGEAEAGGADYGAMAATRSAGEAAPSAGVTMADGEGAAPAPAPATTTATATTTTTVTVETVTEVMVAPEPVEQQRALLTAASVGDHDRRDNYIDFLSRQAHFGRELGIDVTRRARFRVVDGRGRPVNDASIEISIGQSVTRGRTHADGIWDFYPGLTIGRASGQATALLRAGQVSRRINFELPAYGDVGEVLIRLDNAQTVMPAALDLAFAIDVTGSMEDELRYVNSEVAGIVRRVRQAAPEARIRVAATFYRDRTDRHVVQQIAFTENVQAFAQAMESVGASGGGDYPEDMNAGLEASLQRLSWSTGNAVRVLALIADAPPKRYADAAYDYQSAMVDASARGIRILPVAASGADRRVEYLFRALGSVTSSPYVYLTDDSGIGNGHQEADTDRVAVEFFSDLLTRLVISDLRGEGMHEPGVFGPYRQ